MFRALLIQQVELWEESFIKFSNVLPVTWRNHGRWGKKLLIKEKQAEEWQVCGIHFSLISPRGFAHIQLKDNNVCQINYICTQSFIQLDCNNVRSYWTDSFVVLKPLSDQPHVMSSEANSDIMQRWEQQHLHYIPPLIRRWGSLDLMDQWRLQSELCLNINIRPNPSCKHTWGSKRNMNLSVYLSIICPWITTLWPVGWFIHVSTSSGLFGKCFTEFNQSEFR